MVSPAIGSTLMSWWGQELYGLLPGLTASTDAAIAGTVIAVEPHGLRVVETTAAKSGAAIPAGTLPIPEMMEFLASAARRGRKSGTVGLRLPYSACFVRNVELPAVAKRDFGAMLGIDLERSTPFKTRDVLTAFVADDAPSAKGLTKVRHLIIKRKAVDELKTGIEALGLKLTRVECSEADGINVIPVNFLASAADGRSKPRPSGAASKFLAATAAVLAATATYLYVDRHEQALQALQAQTAQLKLKAQSQRDALAKTQSAFTEIANFQKLRSETVSKATILEELTHILPDTAWVTDFKIDGATADISGLAVSAAALVPILERSNVFVDATSTASLTFDPREEKERFSIRARIRTASAPAEPAKAAEVAR
jgi:general secretion pathway protein L